MLYISWIKNILGRKLYVKKSSKLTNIACKTNMLIIMAEAPMNIWYVSSIIHFLLLVFISSKFY